MTEQVYEYTCRGRLNPFYDGKTERHMRTHWITPLTFRKVKPSKESAFRDHILICNNIASFDEFTISAYGHHKYILEIKETLIDLF